MALEERQHGTESSLRGPKALVLTADPTLLQQVTGWLEHEGIDVVWWLGPSDPEHELRPIFFSTLVKIRKLGAEPGPRATPKLTR